jgi:hypothetical protein
LRGCTVAWRGVGHELMRSRFERGRQLLPDYNIDMAHPISTSSASLFGSTDRLSGLALLYHAFTTSQLSWRAFDGSPRSQTGLATVRLNFGVPHLVHRLLFGLLADLITKGISDGALEICTKSVVRMLRPNGQGQGRSAMQEMSA